MITDSRHLSTDATVRMICTILTILPEQNDSVLYPKHLTGSKSFTHYLNDKNRFDLSSKGPSSGISVGGRGKPHMFLYK